MTMEANPVTAFRGLPLSAEQDSEIRHYIHARTRCGLPWDTPELNAMIADMLDPPQVDPDGPASFGDSMDSAQAAAALDDDPDRDSTGASPRS
jgi:hypothetical protein